MAGAGLLDRIFGRLRDRDGQARALEAVAREPLAAPEAAPVPARVPDDPAREIEMAVAARLLGGWLANRQQTLVPHTLNFRVLGPEEGALLLGVMAAAAQADGTVGARERRQLPAALERVGAGEAEAARVEALLEEPQNLGEILGRVQEAGLGAHAYAAALLAIERRGRANRAFLDYLAARLGLGAEVAGSLERRYRA